jgi:hypothetical protein
MIYHNASGRFVERSATSPSPYEGYFDNLFYGGPTEYYFLDGNVFRHTVLNEEYPASCQTDFAEYCAEADAQLCASPDNNVLAYIETGNSLYTTMSTAATSSPTYIANMSIFSKLETESQMSYFGKGACGYIAAAIVLLWYKQYVNTKYVTVNNSTNNAYTTRLNGYYLYNGTPKTYWDGYTFSYNLWRWHSGFGISEYESGNYSSGAGEIQTTIDSYLDSKSISYNDEVYLLPTTTSIISKLNTYQRPYILFGALKPVDSTSSKTNHAVVVYGYLDDTLICHYGWANNTCVSISGVWGSGYMLKS